MNSGVRGSKKSFGYHGAEIGFKSTNQYHDSGGASRFFYQAASMDEVRAYLETLLRQPGDD